MSFEINNLMIVAPEIAILSGACITLISVFNPELNKKIPIISLLIAIFWAIFNIGESGDLFFNNHLYKDDLREVISVFIYLCGLIWILYSPELSKNSLRSEVLALKLFLILGIIVTISSASFVILFMGVELIALPMYTIMALNSAQLKSAIEYLTNGLIGMSIILYGMSFIYGITGSLYISQIYEQINFIMLEEASMQKQIPLFFGLVMIGIGISFKIGSLPITKLLSELNQFLSSFLIPATGMRRKEN